MAKSTTQFVCQECGAVYAKWAGKCDSCGKWNTIVEEIIAAEISKSVSGKSGRKIDFFDLKGVSEKAFRLKSNIKELIITIYCHIYYNISNQYYFLPHTSYKF